ncbi:Predicted flavoprotein CzcO associated with the cation diffusion facilitator CzcD [Thermomonospora echinospora]|uniref:Predicted flavoprotein CzcO associated with the cation diffusion facilitator CzcD n=1 Tax=Thermomonospora echinospora TaxID=1992 RepID=A0A1H6EBI8_9ACTN|nr:NAD(P)/FAD-dependent oxidoreductase [Thermomonospora echinospora]SEG94621.1 Predicted flavoprotein CzcO associated with the cation diffusion facilitator CzcD [Thermomonospora echinospora]
MTTAHTAEPSGTVAPEGGHEIVIVGTGFSGLGMAIALKRAGVHDFVILEKADEVGGTWRENTYPGCACDIMSLLYSYSFEPKADWSRMFPRQRELLEYIKGCVDKYGLRRHIRFGTEVTGAEYVDAADSWQVMTATGETFRTRVLVSAMGPLHRPSIPDLPGLETFTGRTFHSAEWDHDYDLTGKRVAVIGTGASAIQFVPQIAPKVESLTVFQRTPPWIIPKPDRRVTEVEKRLFRSVPGVQRAYRNGIYLMQESFVLGFKNPRLLKAAGGLAQWHLHRQVKDPVLRRKLTPDYTMGCKRTLVSSDYYPALTRPNVELVTEGVKEVRGRSIVCGDGTEVEVDAIIFGTGFHVTDAFDDAHIVGRGGVRIQDAWRDGIQAHLGVGVAGFPNLFLLLGPNSGLGHNSMIFIIEAQVRYVMQCLRRLRAGNATRIAVRPAVQARFNEWVQRKSEGAVWVAGGCTSWYLDRNGRNRAAWPASTVNYWLRTRRVRPSDFELANAPKPASPTEPATIGH